MEDFILGLLEREPISSYGLTRIKNEKHFTERMLERFGIVFNRSKSIKLKQELTQNHEKYYIEEGYRGRFKYKINYEGFDMYVIYSPLNDDLVTVFPTPDQEEVLLYLANPL